MKKIPYPKNELKKQVRPVSECFSAFTVIKETFFGSARERIAVSRTPNPQDRGGGTHHGCHQGMLEPCKLI